MATTTNYSWTTPDDTALVKDGAAAIRSLGSAIDTTVFNNANAAIAKTIVDAKGDIIAATAADTVARLAVGTNGQYLQADSTAATGLKWATVSAGGMTELASGSLSGSTVSLTSISGSYRHLQLAIRSASTTSSSSYYAMRLNGLTSGYGIVGVRRSFTATNTFGSLYGSRLDFNADASFSTPAASTDNTIFVDLYDYATTNVKKGRFTAVIQDGSTDYNIIGADFHNIDLTAAITSIDILTTAGTFDAGNYVLWGVA